MIANLRVVGAKATAVAFATSAATIEPRCARQVNAYGTQLLNAARRHASGRPGPNVITGQFRGSIQREYFRKDGAVAVSVFSDEPQARRLEEGFVGVDVLGRHYNQPPYPTFMPAAAEVEERFVMAIAKEAITT